MPRRRSVKTWLKQVPFSQQLLDLCVKEDDIKEILLSLMKVSSHWYAVGVALGVPVNKLDEIRGNNTMIETMLIQMIYHWVNNTDCPTWRCLIEALNKQGHKTAMSAIIADAERVILKYCEASAMPSKLYRVEIGQEIPTDKFGSELVAVDHREKRLYEKLCGLLNIPMEGASNESLLDNINQHILRSPNLTRVQLREIVLTINRISEESKWRSTILDRHIQELDKDLRSSGKIRAQLIQTRQKLENQIFRLNEELESIKSVCAQQPGQFIEMEKLLKSMAKKESILRDVRCQLKDCVTELQYANCSYQALSDSLNICVVLLEKALRQNKQLQTIAESCKKMSKTYYELFPIFSFSGLFILFIGIEAYSKGVVHYFVYYSFRLFVCAVIIMAGDHLLKYLFQHPLTHRRVSKLLTQVISLLGRCFGFLVGILIVANPSSTVLHCMRSVQIGFYSTLLFSKMYQPTHILTHRLCMLGASIYAGTITIASLLDKNPDGTFNSEVELFSSFLCLIGGLVFGFIMTMSIFWSDIIKSGQVEDPLQWDILCVVVGALISFFSGLATTPAGGAYSLATVLGTSAGTYIGLTCFDNKIFFKQLPENDILEHSSSVFVDNDKTLELATKTIRELRAELVEMEHPY